MNGQQISKEIEKAEAQVKNLKEQIDGERRRLEKFGSKEAYFDYLSKEKEALNNLEILKSKKRSQIMQEICDKEIFPRIDSLRNSPMNEAKRIETVMELALCSAAIGKIKSNFVHYDQVNEVLFEISDPAMALMFAEKKEEITTRLERTQYDIAEVRDEKMTLKNPNQPVIISLPHRKAVELEKAGKGRITQNTEPIFQETIREDREPEVLASIRKMNLGSPIEVNGEISDQAKALQKRSLSARVEISPTNFRFYIQDKDIQKVLKKFE